MHKSGPELSSDLLFLIRWVNLMNVTVSQILTEKAHWVNQAHSLTQMSWSHIKVSDLGSIQGPIGKTIKLWRKAEKNVCPRPVIAEGITFFQRIDCLRLFSNLKRDQILTNSNSIQASLLI